LPAVEDWQRKYTRDLTVAVLTQGDPIENQHWRTSSLDLRLLLQDNSRVSEQYEAEWTPAAVMIRSDGKIASAVTYGVEGIQELVATGVAQKDYGNKKRDLVIKGNGHKPQITLGTSHAGSDLGKLAPSFSLPDLEGNIVNSKDLLVRDTLLLFWDPSCPHCQSMSEEIVKWEEKPPRRAPRLVFVSGGDEENVRAESRKFSSKFLYDSKYETGPLFGTNATPTAVLIDRDGRIASPPTGGVVGILALAGVYKAKSTVETGV
jgi:peroxiredoxin